MGMHEADIGLPSEWVVRWASLIESGTVLDLACGKGRHSRFFLERGLDVVAVDREPREIPGARFVQADLEDGGPWPLAGEQFEGVVVTNYLHRPLFPHIVDALAPGGVVIYETFMVGNERYGGVSNPDFLLEPGELLSAFDALEVLAFEETEVDSGKRRVVQRICARKRPG